MSQELPGPGRYEPRNPYDVISERFAGDRWLVRSRVVAYEAVKDAILGGLLEPHERIIEERLADALQLSRTPVREALAILEHEGLIEAIPYRGVVVKPITVTEFLSMYEALGVIEPEIARAAIKLATANDIATLSGFLDDAEARIPDDVPGHLAACRQFQRRLGEMAQRPFLTRLLLSIEERSDMYLIHSRAALPADKMHASVSDRREILKAIQRGDTDAAVTAARNHAAAIRSRWRDHYVAVE
jgi:DNA-binding GntR family transcriptional regulator